SLAGICDSDLRVRELYIEGAAIQAGHLGSDNCRPFHSIQADRDPLTHTACPAIDEYYDWRFICPISSRWNLFDVFRFVQRHDLLVAHPTVNQTPHNRLCYICIPTPRYIA